MRSKTRQPRPPAVIARLFRVLGLPIQLLMTASFLLAFGASVRAEDIPPLPKANDTGRELLRMFRFSMEMHHRLPGLPIDARFTKISPTVLGEEALIALSSDKNAHEARTLQKFVQDAIQKRLEELGVADELTLASPDQTAFAPRRIDCDRLRLDFGFTVTESSSNGERLAVIVIELLAWQDAAQTTQASKVCLDPEFAPWMRRDATKVLVLRGTEVEAAPDTVREALLSLVDHAVLVRIIASNKHALEAVHSWIGSSQ